MISLNTILDKIDYTSFYGLKDVEIKNIVSLNDHVSDDNITWCGDKYKDKLLKINCGTIVLSQLSYDFVKNSNKNNINWIVVDNPRKTFALILNTFFLPTLPQPKIEASANVHSSVKISDTCYIGNNVIIEEGVLIGESVRINHNTVILANTVIKNSIKIGSNCTIGGVGFGYELNENGEYDLIPHIGNVEINDNAEIGNNVCIDRAVLGSTVIGKQVKIDNLVHIAHGVKINENSLIIANSMIAGSVTIGKNVWIAPSASLIQKINVGDNSLIGIGSTVLKDVDKDIIVAGNPAKKNKI